MNTEWVIGIIVTVFLGLASLYFAWRAHQRAERHAKADDVQRKQDEAARVEREARQALVQREQEEVRRFPNRARFSVIIGPRQSNGRVKFSIINRGPHAATEVEAKLAIGGQMLVLKSASSLGPNGGMPVHVELGNVAGTYELGPDGSDVVHPEVTGEFEINYTDGNGPQTTRKRLNIAAGSRFDQRQISLEDVD